MERIQFKIAAKTNIGIVRTNNEDNFQVSSDLSKTPMIWTNDQICTLGDKGALLVVADGMGGMNAGEVASEIAIDTVRDFFSPEKLNSEKIFENDKSINTYLKQVICEADKKIKTIAKGRPETNGMGTTIVIGWLYGGKLYVAWCGDSRAYIYNKKRGLIQASKDHSYVQKLVDEGKLTKEDAFDYPERNIITRCLSASRQRAIPDVLDPYEVSDDDIIMLCSDGLCGLLKDEEIQQIVEVNNEELNKCVDELISSACDAGGYDNITIAMCKIVSGGKGESIIPTLQPKRKFSTKVLIIIMLGLVMLGGLLSYNRFLVSHNDSDSLLKAHNQDSAMVINISDTINNCITHDHVDSSELVLEAYKKKFEEETRKKLIKEYKEKVETEVKRIKDETAKKEKVEVDAKSPKDSEKKIENDSNEPGSIIKNEENQKKQGNKNSVESNNNGDRCYKLHENVTLNGVSYTKIEILKSATIQDIISNLEKNDCPNGVDNSSIMIVKRGINRRPALDEKVTEGTVILFKKK